MRRRANSFAVLLAGLLGVVLTAGAAWGQSRQGKIDELRRQIELLQVELQTMESQEGDSKVTQLGGSRRKLGDGEVMITRLYDLSDLFVVAPAYPAQHQSDLPGGRGDLFPAVQRTHGNGPSAGGFGGGGFFSVLGGSGGSPKGDETTLGQIGGGVSAESAASARTDIDDLIEAIVTTISPESWDEVGGPASIAPIGNSLIISASQQSHEQIDALVSLFRKRWGTLRTVTIRAHWLWLDRQQLKGLLEEPAEDEQDEPRAFGAVDEEAWQAFLEEQQDDADRGYRAAVTCYNGQTVHLLSGVQRQVVTGVRPTYVGPSGKGDKQAPTGGVGYIVETSLLQEGPALQITPLTNTSGKYVVLDVHSQLVLLNDPPAAKEKHQADRPAQDVAAAVDPPALVKHRLSTTLRVPAERRMLVGGMTFHGAADVARGDADLYLFVRASVQELRDDLEDELSVDEPPTDKKEKPKESSHD